MVLQKSSNYVQGAYATKNSDRNMTQSTNNITQIKFYKYQ